MFCANCGQQVADGVKFCPHCGAPQPVATQRNPSREGSAYPAGGFKGGIGKPTGMPTQNFRNDVQQEKAGQGWDYNANHNTTTKPPQPQPVAYTYTNQSKAGQSNAYQANGQERETVYTDYSSAGQDKASVLLCILSVFLPLVGFILYFVYRTKAPQKAKGCLIAAGIGFGLRVLYNLFD